MLKTTLDVNEGSQIFSRSARNNVEHLDERIDNWITAGPERLLEMVFDNRKRYEFLYRPEVGEQCRWFLRRVYLVEEDVFISQGREGVEEIDLAALTAELCRIKHAAHDFLACDEAVNRLSPFGTLET